MYLTWGISSVIGVSMIVLYYHGIKFLFRSCDKNYIRNYRKSIDRSTSLNKTEYNDLRRRVVIMNQFYTGVFKSLDHRISKLEE